MGDKEIRMLDESLVIPNVIAAHADRQPDRVFIREVGGRSSTYGDIHQLALTFAGAFLRAGVAPGDRVLTMSPPRTDWLAAWMGLSRIGAVDVGVNTGFRGRMLDYVLTKARARVLVVAGEFLDRLNDDLLEAAGIEGLIVLGEVPACSLRTRMTAVEDFLDGAPRAGADRRCKPWELSCIVLTSGTTGPSKLVMVPWGSIHCGATGILPYDDITADDVWYQPLPTYHLAAKFGISLMALKGAQVVQRETFSLRDFWPDVRQHGCTVTNVSPFARLLEQQPAQPDDADNPLRGAVMNPLLPNYQEFSRRFGVRICASYGTSELGVPIVAGWDPVPKSCGRPRVDYPGAEVRLVDEHDDDVRDGQVGEMVIRTREPWSLTAGYFDNPEATAAAWRNGWFHIGDAMRRDQDGNLFFVDRVKDTIRRRGENISSFEVEAEVNAHPAVAECGAVAVPIPGEEDEVKVFVVTVPGAELPPGELIEFLVPRMAKFMVPRYVEFVDELPKTEATFRIKKAELRARGNGELTWDRESAATAVTN
jgi:crotonobetaine/carnitine-CoA ligase